MSETREFSVEVNTYVRVTINDPNVILRATENQDSFRENLYDLRTEKEVLDMLARNAVLFGTRRVNQLDGWADLPDDAATMYIDDVDDSYVQELRLNDADA